MWPLVFALFAQAPTDLPRFDQFRVTETFDGAPTRPRLQTANQNMYRTEIRSGALGIPNFAGHFTVILWGCGSACLGGAIADARTGDVVDLPFRNVGAGAGYQFADGTVALQENWQMISFKPDSSLLIVRGCLNDDAQKCAIYFYQWHAHRVRLLRSIRARPA